MGKKLSRPPRSVLLHNAGALVSTNIAGRVIRFVYLLAIARLLAPEQTGVYLYGIALYLSLLSLAHMGQNVFLSTRLGRGTGRRQRAVEQSLFVVLAAAIPVSVGLLIYIWLTEPARTTAIAISFFALTLFARVLASWARNVFVALEDATWIPRYETGFRTAEAICGVVALLAGGGLLAICFFHFLFWALEAVFSFRRLIVIAHLAPIPGASWRYLKKMLGVSTVDMFGAWMMTLITQIGIVLLARIQSDTSIVANFGIAMQFMTTFLILPASMAEAFMPSLSRAYRDGGELSSFTLATKLLLIVGAAAAILGISFGPWFIVLILGDDYRLAAGTIAGLCWALPAFAAAMFISRALTVMGERRRAIAMMFTMVVIHGGAMLLFRNGAYVGLTPVDLTVVSLVLASTIGAAMGFFAVQRRLGSPGHQWWLRPVGAVAAAFAVLAFGIVSGAAPIQLLGPLALAVLAGTVWLTRAVTGEDLAKIRRNLHLG